MDSASVSQWEEVENSEAGRGEMGGWEVELAEVLGGTGGILVGKEKFETGLSIFDLHEELLADFLFTFLYAQFLIAQLRIIIRTMYFK